MSSERDPQADPLGDALAGTRIGSVTPASGGHEPDAASPRPILIGALGLGLLLALGVLIPTLLQPLFLAREARQSAPANPLVDGTSPRRPPTPRLQTNPWRDIAELRASEDAILQSYGWVDRKGGVVRIPIDRAMDLVARGSGSAAAPATGGQR